MNDESHVGALLTAAIPTEPPTHDPFVRVRARVIRRRQYAALTSAGAVLAVAAIVFASLNIVQSVGTGRVSPANATPPAYVHSAADLRQYVHDARIDRPVVFDSGLLRLDPPSGSASIDESAAINLFRSTSVPLTYVTGVVVFRADVTLQVPVEPVTTIRMRSAAAFVHRLAWVVLWAPETIYCGLARSESPLLPPRQNVALIAADGTDEGISYATAGSFCDRNVPTPHASVLGEYESVPWERVTLSAKRGLTIRFTVPACAVPSAFEGDGSTLAPVTVFAWRAMVSPPCAAAPQRTATETIAAPHEPLAHGPTGALHGIMTGPAGRNPYGFTYYDGHVRVAK